MFRKRVKSRVKKLTILLPPTNQSRVVRGAAHEGSHWFGGPPDFYVVSRRDCCLTGFVIAGVHQRKCFLCVQAIQDLTYTCWDPPPGHVYLLCTLYLYGLDDMMILSACRKIKSSGKDHNDWRPGAEVRKTLGLRFPPKCENPDVYPILLYFVSIPLGFIIFITDFMTFMRDMYVESTFWVATYAFVTLGDSIDRAKPKQQELNSACRGVTMLSLIRQLAARQIGKLV